MLYLVGKAAVGMRQVVEAYVDMLVRAQLYHGQGEPVVVGYHLQAGYAFVKHLMPLTHAVGTQQQKQKQCYLSHKIIIHLTKIRIISDIMQIKTKQKNLLVTI